MSEPKVIFFDVGGVLLSNGWDRQSRRAACRHFDLDWEDFQDRHEFVVDAFERGELDLDTYLRRTVFYRERSFGEQEFIDYIKACSKPNSESLELLAALGSSRRYLLAALNNESRELNEHRIETFGLRDHFSLFLSSCYLGVRKPEPDIYRMAVDVVQTAPEECVLVDDRPLNVECAVLQGIRAVRFTDASRLADDLGAFGIRL